MKDGKRSYAWVPGLQWRPLSRLEEGPGKGLRAEEASDLVLMALVSGLIQIQVPELGLRTVQAGEWALLRDVEGASRVISKEATGFRAEIPLSVFGNGDVSGERAPSKLACLFCPHLDGSFFTKGSCCGRLAQLAEELREEPGPTLSSAWMSRSRLAEFMGRFLERPELHANPACRSCCCGRDREAIETAARYMEENLGEEHSLSKLARRVHLNEWKLKKGFKEHFGTTVFGYLREKRMEEAWHLLRETEATVLEVANTVGYSNPSHFARAFRDVHALNPREVRRKPDHSSVELSLAEGI